MTLDEAIKRAEEVAEENEKVSLYKPIDFCVTGEIEKCTKCAAEYRQLAEWLKELKQLREQTRCEDCISRRAVIQIIENKLNPCTDMFRCLEISEIKEDVEHLQPVTPQPKTGRWIYDKTIENWRCSECNETPKTLGYVGTTDFMAEHFSFCNHCGSKMEVEK